MNIVNQRIKEWRGIIKLSVEDFSEKTGIRLDRLQKIEAGKAKVTLDEVIAVANAFYLSTDYLLGHREKPSPVITSEEEAKVWAQIEHLGVEQLEELKKEMQKMGVWEE